VSSALALRKKKKKRLGRTAFNVALPVQRGCESRVSPPEDFFTLGKKDFFESIHGISSVL
jgi:hypothetical protein